MFPINERISQQLLATLAGVTLQAGFSVTLSPQRYTRRSVTPFDLLTILDEGDDAPAGDEDTPIGFNAWSRPYAVKIYRLQPENAQTPWAQLISLARAAVEKAVMADLSRGGLAQSTEIAGPEEFSDENDVGGVIVGVRVNYRHPFDDPYSLG